MKKEAAIQSSQVTTIPDNILNQIQGIHARAEHWLSDLEFYQEEIIFLQQLVGQNFTELFDLVEPGRAKTVTDQIDTLQTRSRNISTQVTQLLSDLKDQVVDPFAHDFQPLRVRIGELEVRQSDFLKRFRELKRQVFELTLKALKSGRINTSNHQRQNQFIATP